MLIKEHYEQRGRSVRVFGVTTIKVLVAQIGARRHYAVPRAFADAGMLNRFCTDVYLKSRTSQKVLMSIGKMLGSKRLSGLAARRESALPSELVTTFPFFGLDYKWRVRRSRTFEERAGAWIAGGRKFCELAIHEVGKECDTVYAFSSAALELFEYGRETGRRCCLDHATAPLHAEMSLAREESERFEGWSVMDFNDVGMNAYRDRQQRECQLADVVLCGSGFARRLIEAGGVPGERIRTVPLGISPGYRTTPGNRPSPIRDGKLRVLFVGSDGLRKGIGYLSEAVAMLDSRFIEARVAGDLGITRYGLSKLERNLEVLGSVPRAEMGELYQWADVLVLPSVSDTFGIVILEAMAAGLPVITTPNTGGADVIREGLDGFIVPIRDSQAIAERLELLVSDPDLLSTMSHNTVERVRDFSLEKYSERLVNATRGES